MDHPVKIGLIGAGYLGKRHLNHLLQLGSAELVGVWDIDPVVRDQIIQMGAPVANNMDELLNQSEGIVLVTPTSTHFQLGKAVLEAKRHLFVEKPLAATSQEGAILVSEAQRNRLVLQVGHIERFNPAVRALAGLKVKPHFIESHRLSLWNPRGSDVAVVFDLMIHDIDLVLQLMGEVPGAIRASGVGVVSPHLDIANARLEFSAGRVANLTASRISLKKMRKMRLFGEQEYLALDLEKGQCEVVRVYQGEEAIPSEGETIFQYQRGDQTYQIHRWIIPPDGQDAMRMELEAFCEAIRGKREVTVPGSQALVALQIAEQITDIITSSLPNPKPS